MSAQIAICCIISNFFDINHFEKSSFSMMEIDTIQFNTQLLETCVTLAVCAVLPLCESL